MLSGITGVIGKIGTLGSPCTSWEGLLRLWYLEHVLQEDAQLASEGLPIDSPRRQEIKEKKEKRIQDLLPVYKQVRYLGSSTLVAYCVA